MEKKTMYALTFCYEGNPNNDTYRYATTIAVSDDKDKLIAEMNKCIEEDCGINEEDEWDDEYNYNVIQKVITDYIAFTVLRHNKHTDLYTKYHIAKTEVL